MKLALLLISCYYDDFPHVECERLAKSGEDTFKQMLDILGIDVSTSAHKDVPFFSVSSNPSGLRLTSLRHALG